MRKLVVILAFAFVLVNLVLSGLLPVPWVESTVERSADPAEVKLLEDDRLEDKSPIFEPDLVDSRPVTGRGGAVELNASAAVIKLDIEPAEDEALQKLHPSYGAASSALRAANLRLLPSINAIDGKAKQFDDGLYAALDAGFTHEKLRGFHETTALVRRLMGLVPPLGQARPWLYAALKAGDFLSADEAASPPAGVDGLVAAFERWPGSKATSFYTWSPELTRTWRFLRFLSQPFASRAGVPEELAAALAADEESRTAYARLLDLYRRLTSPFDVLDVARLAGPAAAGTSLDELAAAVSRPRHPVRAAVAFLPEAGTPTKVLFRRLFGEDGVPAGVEMMTELVKAVRSGRVDLAPGPDAGWLDYQVHALEVFLLPERGAEASKLLLTRRYKERMLQAFKVLLTKRYETHARQMGFMMAGSAAPPEKLSPRLRVEPNPTYFLRVARSYAFLETFLSGFLPEGTLARLRGRSAQGERPETLAAGLEGLKGLFYGLHLISCEDIGARPSLLAGEVGDPAACTRAALDWLVRWTDDPDVAVDTRVAVPMAMDVPSGALIHWATLGVRGARLRASYVKPPSWRGEPTSPWQVFGPERLEAQDAVVLVDEFAELRVPGGGVLTREALRSLCDRCGTKAAVVQAAARQP